jgi:tetratricopeptide (TPR) repeat protein
MLEMKLDLLEIERKVHLEDHDVEGVVTSDLEIAECLIQLGRWQEAIDHADGLENLYTWFGDTSGQIRILLVRAKGYLELRDFEKAASPLIDAQSLAAWSEDKVDWEMLARVEEIRAYSHSIQGFEEDAIRVGKEVERIREILGYEKEEKEQEALNG